VIGAGVGDALVWYSASRMPTTPGARPLRAVGREALLERFEGALEEKEGASGAHCIHELWMRNEPPMNIEAMIARLWSAASDTVPEWLPMRYVSWLSLAYEVAAQSGDDEVPTNGGFMCKVTAEDAQGAQLRLVAALNRFWSR